MRDAQSLLDQMIAFFAVGNKEHLITDEEVRSLFGLADAAEVDKIVAAVLRNDPGAVILGIHNLTVKGKNLETLFEDVLFSLRSVEISAILPDASSVLEESPEQLSKFKEMAAIAPLSVIQEIMEILGAGARPLRDALNKQIYLETLLLKAMKEAHALKISDLIQHLNRLRQEGDLKYMDLIQTPVQRIELPSVQIADVKKNDLTVEEKKEEIIETAVEAVAETVEESAAETVVDNTVETAVETVEAEEPEKLSESPEIEEVEEVKEEIKQETVVENGDFEDSYIPDMPPPDMMDDGGDFEEIVDVPHPPAVEKKVESQVQKQGNNAPVKEQKAPEAGPMRVSVADNIGERNRILQNKGVQQILDIFGGELVDIHVDRNQNQ